MIRSGRSVSMCNALRRMMVTGAGVLCLCSCDAPLPSVPDGGDATQRPARSCGPGSLRVDGATVSYENDIRPIFQGHGCLTTGCHGGGLFSMNYSLETYEGMFGPGDEAQTLGQCDVVPGDPAGSFLLEKISSDAPRIGLRMPYNRTALTDEEVELIRRWIEEGAADD